MLSSHRFLVFFLSLEFPNSQVEKIEMEVTNNHSTLEVRCADLLSYDSFKEPISAPIARLPNNDYNLSEVVTDQTNRPVVAFKQPRTILTLRPREFWIVILLILLIIAAAVSGSVGYVTTHHSKSSLNNTPIPGGGPGNSGASQIIDHTGLAAIAWNDTYLFTQYRLYY